MYYLQYEALTNSLYTMLFGVCFKPYYKWITFNTTMRDLHQLMLDLVLNLIINGLPSILKDYDPNKADELKVLNLIINGLPSILI